MSVSFTDNTGFDKGFYDESGATTVNRYSEIGLVGSGSSSWKVPSDMFKRPTGSMPAIVNPRFLGKNGFYTNGPTFNPLAEAQARQNAVNAYVQSWAKPEQKDYLDRFASLVNTFGTTNSAGTLTALAQTGLDPNTPAVQGLLKADAAANMANIGATKPALATTVATDDEENWFQNLMQPVEAYARQSFQYLNAPFQAVDALVRTTGGAVAALLGDDAARDRFANSMEYGGPLNQIDAYQTLKSVFVDPTTGNFDFDPWSAINQYQAGLDVNRAMEEIQADPANAELVNDPNNSGKVMKLAEDIAKKNNWYVEPGWFVDETSQVGEEQRRATYDAWAIPGPNNQLTAWTLGRGVAGATLGPDHEAYSMMSGFIDGAWNIAADPFTYFAGAGLIPKSIAITSKALSGGQKVIRVGRVAQKWRQTIATANQINAKTVDEYNEFARSAGIDEITATEFAGLEVARQADVVKTAQKANATQGALDKVGLNPDIIQNGIADLRRAASVEDKVSGIASNAEDVETLIAARALADDYQQYVTSFSADGKPLVSLEKVNEWIALNGQDGYDQMIQYKTLQSAWEATQTTRMTAAESAAGFGKYVDEVLAASEGRISNVNAGTAIADATRAALNDPFDIAEFGDDLPMGATIRNFAPGQPMQGVMNGSAVMAYADEAANLVVRGGDELIDDSIRTNLANSLLNILADPRLNRSPVTLGANDVDNLTSATAEQISKADNAKDVITDLFADPTTTFAGALKTITRLGLDGYFDDFLRASGVDGIGDGVQSGQRGTWFGEHPMFEAYRIPDDIQEIAQQAVNSGDPESFLSSLTKGNRVDLHGMSATDSMMFLLQQRKKYADIVNNARNSDAALIEKARLGQAKLDSMIKNIDDSWADPAEALKGVMSHEAGMRLLNGQGTLDAAGVRNFLFGYGPSSKMGQKALEVMGNFLSKDEIAKILREDGSIDQDAYAAISHDWLGRLHDVTGGKWSPDTYRKVFDNSLYERGFDGLVDVIAPRLGIDVSQGSLSKTVAMLGSDGLRDFRTWHTAQPIVKRTMWRAIRTPEYLGRLRPNSRPVDIINSSEIAGRMREYGDWLGLDENITNNLIGKVISADGTFGAAAVNRNALVDMFKAMGTRIADDLDESVWFKNGRNEKQKDIALKAMYENISIYLGGKTGEATKFGGYSDDSVTGGALSGTGGSLKFPSFMIDSELATGVVNLPGVEDLMEVTTRLGRALSALPKGTDAYGFSKRFYDNFFRTSLLVGRGAYILRNSAEMQVRMFLNGHQSILNSPATLIGMTIGNAATRNLDPNSFLAQTFGPYRNTILGTDFTVGKDAARAAANHTEEFFNLIHMSHALTDQRVYNSGVRQGWVPLAVDAPKFNDGWAHELIMLHRSDIARLVLRDSAPIYPGKQAAATQYDEIMDYFLSDAPEMFKLRQIMVAGDEQFKNIFSDRMALKDYLFENTNSVLNRVKTFTRDDPSLQEFVRTGKYAVGDLSYSVNDIPELSQRVKDLAFMLKKGFRSTEADDAATKAWFESKNVKVPWVEKGDGRQGNYLVNKFFDVANSIERIGSVGPEFRMAYWDKIEELAPAINADDIDRALDAARTTLGVIGRLGKNGIAENIGASHGVYAALKKVKAKGDNGNLTLDEVHDIAMKYAAEDVTNLFYDAARRNDTWSALRLIFPFGQAWGNTLKTWGELGKKNPLQVYKIMKVLNGAQMEGSSAIYEMLDGFGVYPDYAPGGAPYDQDASGGFFYQDQEGSTKFMLPFGGALTGAPLRVWSLLSGIDAPTNVGVESPVQSLNFAVGADSIFPGVTSFAASSLDALPDNAVVQQAKAAIAPFGSQNVAEATIAPWLQNMIAGAGAVPIVGGVLENFVGVLSPQKKNKYLADAMTYLSSTGKYNLTDPMHVQRLNEDSKSLSSALLLTGGLFQNLSPASPQFQIGVDAKKNTAEMTQDTGHYAISMFNFLKKGYLARNGNDTTDANLEMVQDFGPTALFALVGDWKGMERQPTSEALAFAYKHPEIAKAYNGQFQYFFPGGDSSDIQAREWAQKNASAEATRKSAKEISNEVVSWMIKVQRARIESQYAADSINEGQYDAAIAELKDRYTGTAPASVIFTLDKSEELDKFRYMYDQHSEIRNSKAGIVFNQAWSLRDQALSHARNLTGRENTTLNGKKTALIKEKYYEDIDTLVAQHPEFKLLGLKFKREFE